MIELPPIPTWDGLHPLVVHFPIALLLVAPLFVIIGTVVSAPHRRPFLITALILMVLGTTGTFVAVSTGEAAGKLAERSPEINAALEHHEELAETTRAVFASLTVAFAAMLLGPWVVRRELERKLQAALAAVFLLLYGAGAVILANTAHNGGRLVHQYGVQALMPPAASASASLLPGDADGD